MSAAEVVHLDGHIGPEDVLPEPRSLELVARRTRWQRLRGRGPGVLPVFLLARSNYFQRKWQDAERKARGLRADALTTERQLEYAMGALSVVAAVARGSQSQFTIASGKAPLDPEELLEYVASTAERSRRHVLNMEVAAEMRLRGRGARV